MGSSIACPRLDERLAGAHRVVVAPAAVGVDVQIGAGQGVTDRAHRRDVQLGCAPDLDLEGGDPEGRVISVASSAIAAGSPNEIMCAAATSSAKPPRSVWHGQPRIWPARSDGQVDRAAGDVVAGDRGAALGHELGAQRIEVRQRVAEGPAHGVDDRGLGLAVGVGARLRLGLADEAGVAVHAHEHVVRAADAARRESRRAPVGQRERDRFDAGDPGGAHERRRIGAHVHSSKVGSGNATSNTNHVSIGYVLDMNGGT